MEMDSQTGERPARRWTRAEYDRIVEAGILGPADKVELIEGEILVVSPEGPRHVAAIGELADALRGSFGSGFWIRLGNPVALDDESEPEPDLLVVPGEPRDFRDHHPGVADAALVVEVSQSSIAFDLGRKLRLYARAGVPEYWVLDLVHGCVHVHRDPAGNTFRDVTRHERGSSMRPLRATGVAVAFARLFD